MSLRQLSLFEDQYIKAPSNGVRTSDEAAEAMGNDGSRLRRLVFNLIAFHGGLTCQEVEHITGIAHETVSARIWELRLKGWLLNSWKKRRTVSGRSAYVWVVPTQPLEKPEASEKTDAAGAEDETEEMD